MEMLVMSRDNELFQRIKQLDIRPLFWVRNIREAKQVLQTKEVKVIILDLQGQEKEGFSLALYIRGMHHHYLTPLMILAENSHYEKSAFYEAHCFAYYTKRLGGERFWKDINHLMYVMNPSCVPSGMVFRTRAGIHRIEVSDIRYLEILKHNIFVHTSYDVLQYPYRTMSDCLSQGRGKLLQCHRSLAVNPDYIEYVDYGNRTIYLKGDQKSLDIGPKYIKTIWGMLTEDKQTSIL